MRSTNMKTTFIAILMAVVLILSGATANAVSFKFELDNKGNTWELANTNYLGSVGFKDLDITSTFTLADIQGQISKGTAVKFYAGTNLNGLTEFVQLSPSTEFDYTGSATQTITNAFYVEFSPTKIQLDNFGFKGSKTLKDNGKMGFLSTVPAPVPIPASWIIISGGLLIISGVKRTLS
ncbi:hypothetical protein [Maridesulfovibrio frigidus]|uniref:hypothetical protein n=1 Tax=Maridesulfovibrio frigidus TaxID=340956 RepID=UPI0004E28090|nr:hypothetical protein [Maridesulfovibrio frigidus]